MIWNITLPANSCFEEPAASLLYGLQDLGLQAQKTDYVDDGMQNVVFGAHLLPLNLIPKSAIIYNFEQVGAFKFYDGFLEGVKDYQIWDYSSANVAAWAKLGVFAQHVPVGYVKQLTKIEPMEESIDILFMGLINDRRYRILTALAASGLKMAVAASGVWGEKKDNLIAAAKVCLNMHFYHTNIFEIGRCAYYLANSKAVVTETSVDDDDYRYLRPDGIVYAPYSGLVDSILALVRDEERRQRVAQAGFEKFSRHRASSILAPILTRMAA